MIDHASSFFIGTIVGMIAAVVNLAWIKGR